MGSLRQDLRFAARTLLASPGFTLVAVLVLALGIGANAAIFSVVNAVLLRPPSGVSDRGRLVTVYTSDFSGPAFGTSSWPDYLDFRAAGSALEGLAAHTPTPVSVTPAGETRRAFADVVSGNYFQVLGVRPPLGRGLHPADEAPGARLVAVVSHGFWQAQLGGDPAVVGRPLQVNGQPFTVVGVAPAGFGGILRGFQPDLWVPASAAPIVAPGSEWLDERGNRSWFLVGRLAADAGRAQAQARFDVLARELHAAHPDEWTDVQEQGRRITVLPEAEGRVFPQIRKPLVGFLGLLLGIVGIVLLVACANLAGLLLSRAAGRRREIAIRLALGAGRGRLVRQLLTESTLLALLGGGAGVLVAVWISGAIGGFRPPLPVPIAVDPALDARVLLFAIGVSLVTGIAFGLAPALQASRPELVPALKGEGPLRGPRASRLRSTLLATQVALSLVLLVGGGLLLRSLHAAQAIDPGFDANRVVLLSLEPQLVGYDEARSQELYRRLLERVRALPQVREASVAALVPLGLGSWRRGVAIEGNRPAPGEDGEVHLNIVGARYFETMGIPLLRGRAFDERDRHDAPPVAVVNEAFARRYWPGQGPIGKRLGTGRDEEGLQTEVVGLVGDTKHVTLGEEPRPVWYLPVLQDPVPDLTLHVRTGGDPAALGEVVRAEVRALDPRLPVFDVRPLSAHLGLALFPQRVAGALLGAFGFLALLLAAVGLYGVVAQAVAQRTREVGLRMALGAQRGQVVWLVLRESALAVSLGLVFGLVVAGGATRFLSGLLNGVSPTDPRVFLAVALLLASVALLGSWVPARRAARVDPMAALRHE